MLPPIIKTARTGLLFFLTISLTTISSNLFAQAIRNAASNPTDNLVAGKAGPITAVTPPLGMQAGDLVVMYGQYQAAGASMSISQTGGQAWDTATKYSPAGSNQTIAVYWCTYNGSWVGPDPSVTIGAGTNALSNIMYVFSPSAANKKWAIHNAPTNSTSTGATNTITGLATTVPNTVTVGFWSTSATNNSWGTLASTGNVWSKTSLSAQYRNTTGSDQSHSAAYYIRPTAGAAVNVSQNQSVTTATVLKSIMTWYELNDECANAVTLTNATTNSTGTVWGATASNIIPVDCATGTPDDDVWYKFTPANPELSIILSNVGSNLATSGTRLQLFSGTCGSLTSLTCGTTSIVTTVVSGATYYIRVYSAGAGSIGGAYTGSAFSITATASPTITVTAGRNKEVFKQTTLSGSGALQYPWEVTYGPDNNLWITEARGYKVYRMDPNTGIKKAVLDLNSTSTDLTAWGADTLRAVNLTSQTNWNATAANWPQGGLAGLALHPQFLDGTGLHDYVYVSYVHRFLYTASGSAGIFFRNKIVRFTYNSGTDKLGDPKVICDTIPGGQDHNSQRMIIARTTPGGAYYLFYACGDMGAGQFANRLRAQNAQNVNSYEGKILRFNLDNGGADGWIPSDNPYSSSSAVWCVGMRNNQGFAYDSTLNILYGSSHGAYSDDEINIIEKQRNYGHPYIIGYADGNYNGNPAQGTDSSVSAGSPWPVASGASTCLPIGDEVANIAVVNAKGLGAYKDPLFSAYAAPNGPITTQGTIKYIWKNNPANAPAGAPGWPSEAWSGLDLYSNSKIPGWKKSLVASSLKWGRLIRIKLGASGTITMPSNDPRNNAGDTISYFGSTNRFRDIAFSPTGREIFVVMDNSSTTSGPGSANPVVPACAGCVQKYTFLGYNVNTGSQDRSYIPTTIEVAAGDNCIAANTVTINTANANKTLWVPITDENSNIVAEIYAQGQNLGNIVTSVYHNTGAIRTAINGKKYLDRNITITPQYQPTGDVRVRLYITKAEYLALQNSPGSLITAPIDLKVFKNNDPCSSAISSVPTVVAMDFNTELFGTDAYILQGTINSFSTFYFAATSFPTLFTLPLDLLSFSGQLQNNNSVLLNWKTENEINTSHFVVERSADGISYNGIGNVTANGRNNTAGSFNYSFTDNDAINQSSQRLYYRLKMVDVDGKFKYSNIIAVSFPLITGKLSIAPNPVTTIANIAVAAEADGRVQWKLTDNVGRVMLKGSDTVKKGAGNNFTINMNRLSAGTYNLSVTGAGIDQNVKLQKL